MVCLLLKRLAPTEVGWFRRDAAQSPSRGPRVDAPHVRKAFGTRRKRPIEIRVRWYDGRRVVEDRRRLVRGGDSWWFEGAPLKSEHLRVGEGDVLVVRVERVADVVEGERFLLTVDAWMNRALRDPALAPFLRRALDGRASALISAGDDHPLLVMARQHLPGFGGGHASEAQSLTPRDYALARTWMVEHVRVRALESLLEMRVGTVAEQVLHLMGSEHVRRSRRGLADVVLHRFGNDLLADARRREIVWRERFRDAREPPPIASTWIRGSRTARVLVRQLGLPAVMAGHPVPATPDFEDVSAFPTLGPLHEYQRQIAAGIRDVLVADDWTERRAVVWLPTGTGKTRVCVETLLMELFLSPPRNVILWVADREELCEQAIETFRHVWMVRGMQTPSARGHAAPMLRVVRLWGGRPWQEVPSFPTLVVASIQTLASRIGHAEFRRQIADLAERCAAVVFDEAHHVVAPSYSRVIQALGLGRLSNMEGRNRRTGPPLLGLTATPGRSRQDETERLVARFAGRLLEPDPPYRAMDGFIGGGFLAKLDVEIVPTGYVLQKRAEEDAEWSRYRVLPRSTLRLAGRDPARTAVILQDLERRLDDLGSVLVFACSVEHAEVMAEVLSQRGRRAEALHGGSPRALRQSAIRRFRERVLQILVTCDLLTTGFDAPNVDAVVVARPVESRVLYAQMIGRGLRGPRNGGTDHCLVLDYEDSIGPFRTLESLRTHFRSAFLERAAPRAA